MKQPGLQMVITWGAAITDSKFTFYTTMLTCLSASKDPTEEFPLLTFCNVIKHGSQSLQTQFQFLLLMPLVALLVSTMC